VIPGETKADWIQEHLAAFSFQMGGCHAIASDKGVQHRLPRHGNLGQRLCPDWMTWQIVPPNTSRRILVKQARNEILKGRADT
jgi:hypothetical protein